MYELVKDNIIKHNLISSGDTVLCALSGGADSVCMLLLLARLSRELQFTICAAHINHMLRADAANSDEEFVRSLCDRLCVPLYVKKIDVAEYARKHGQTIEQAGRTLRYDFFDSIECDKIATAHHMDDQAESILMHIVRGSGLAGLCGMKNARGKLIRPLLCVRRRQIEEFLSEIGQDYCTDETNLIADGTRNKLRLDMIPYVASSINPRFVETLCAMGNLAAADNAFLEELAQDALKNACCGENEYSRAQILCEKKPIQTRMLRKALANIGVLCDVEQKHIDMLCELLSAQTGKELFIPHAHVRISYDRIVFSPDMPCNQSIDYELPLTFGKVCLPDSTVWYFERVSGHEYEKNPNCLYLDIDKLPNTLVIRTRKNGDRFLPLGACGKKKLKDYYIDKKLRREQRLNPLLCERGSSDILCILGMSIADTVRVCEDTTAMLLIKKHNGRKE